MRYRIVMLVLSMLVGGCSVFNTDDRHYSVFFQALSTELDQQALATVHAAAVVARANPMLPVALAGYASPPDPVNNDVLSAQRAARVQLALIADGVGAERISTLGHGTTDPNGLPNLSVQRVDISIGP